MASGSQLRKLKGENGIDIATNITSTPDGSSSSELLISGSALLDSIANLTAALNTKQDVINTLNPLPTDYVFGLQDAFAAASVVVDIAGVTGLTDALAAKQGVLSPSRPCKSRACNAR